MFVIIPRNNTLI